MRLVIDASAAVQVCLAGSGFDLLDGHDLSAPVLLRFEVLSVLHEAVWRKQISVELAAVARQRLSSAPVTFEAGADAEEAWDVSERLGWAKTYDAEYVALARREQAPLLTLDRRLARGAARLVQVLTPEQL